MIGGTECLVVELIPLTLLSVFLTESVFCNFVASLAVSLSTSASSRPMSICSGEATSFLRKIVSRVGTKSVAKLTRACLKFLQTVKFLIRSSLTAKT